MKKHVKSLPEESMILTVVKDYPEWKHTILKWLARLLFIDNVNWVILVNDVKEKHDN